MKTDYQIEHEKTIAISLANEREKSSNDRFVLLILLSSLKLSWYLFFSLDVSSINPTPLFSYHLLSLSHFLFLSQYLLLNLTSLWSSSSHRKTRMRELERKALLAVKKTDAEIARMGRDDALRDIATEKVSALWRYSCSYSYSHSCVCSYSCSSSRSCFCSYSCSRSCFSSCSYCCCVSTYL